MKMLSESIVEFAKLCDAKIMRLFAEKFSKKEVDELIFETIRCSMDATLDWIKEETDIVQMGTKNVLENTEITLKPDAKKLSEYVHKKMAEKGIIITPKTKTNVNN
jgi:hypothetical protein